MLCNSVLLILTIFVSVVVLFSGRCNSPPTTPKPKAPPGRTK